MSQTPLKPEHATKREALGNGYEIERRLAGYARAKNGNTGNPTPRFRWNLYLDGQLVDMAPRRTPLAQEAKKDSYR